MHTLKRLYVLALLLTTFASFAGGVPVSADEAGPTMSVIASQDDETADTDLVPYGAFNMVAFLDTDNDGQKGPGEAFYPYGTFGYAAANGATQYMTSCSGQANIREQVPGSYSLTFATNSTIFVAGVTSIPNITVDQWSIQTYYFPVTAASMSDVAVSMSTAATPRPGFSYTYDIRLTNKGTTTASGNLAFIKDSKLPMATSLPSGATATEAGFSVPFADLLPFEQQLLTVSFQVPALPQIALGDRITASVAMNGVAGDVVPLNDVSYTSEIVTGAYDPNDITESHGPKIGIDQFTSADYLYYTIRFENTGNASADFVIIEDVLDEKLDFATASFVNSSHSVMMGKTENKLRLLFPGINLEPSVPNTDLGKGFVTFAVRPTAGFAVGDVIPNHADIFFDFNPPITTNVFETEFVASLSSGQFDDIRFTAWPNPVKGIVSVEASVAVWRMDLVDATGKQLRSAIGNTIDLTGCASGIYFLRIATERATKTIRLVKE